MASVAVAAAISVYRFYMPQTVTVAVTSTPAVRVVIDGVEWTNGTTIDWGTIHRGGSKSKDLIIYNDDDITVRVYIVPSLPSDWEMHWSENATLISGHKWTFTRPLTLTISPDAEPGPHTFDAWLMIKPS